MSKAKQVGGFSLVPVKAKVTLCKTSGVVVPESSAIAIAFAIAIAIDIAIAIAIARVSSLRPKA